MVGFGENRRAHGARCVPAFGCFFDDEKDLGHSPFGSGSDGDRYTDICQFSRCPTVSASGEISLHQLAGVLTVTTEISPIGAELVV